MVWIPGTLERAQQCALPMCSKRLSKVDFPGVHILGSIGYSNKLSLLDSPWASDHLCTHRSNGITVSILQYRVKFWMPEIVPRLDKLSKEVGAFCIGCGIGWGIRGLNGYHYFMGGSWENHKIQVFDHFSTVSCKSLKVLREYSLDIYLQPPSLRFRKYLSVIEIHPKRWFFGYRKNPLSAWPLLIHSLTQSHRHTHAHRDMRKKWICSAEEFLELHRKLEAEVSRTAGCGSWSPPFRSEFLALDIFTF